MTTPEIGQMSVRPVHGEVRLSFPANADTLGLDPETAREVGQAIVKAADIASEQLSREIDSL